MVNKVASIVKNIGYIIASIALLVFIAMFVLTAINGGYQFLTGGKNIFGAESDSHQQSDGPCISNGPGITSC